LVFIDLHSLLLPHVEALRHGHRRAPRRQHSQQRVRSRDGGGRTWREAADLGSETVEAGATERTRAGSHRRGGCRARAGSRPSGLTPHRPCAPPGPACGSATATTSLEKEKPLLPLAPPLRPRVAGSVRGSATSCGSVRGSFSGQSSSSSCGSAASRGR
jgi:hypothetical protein